MTNITRFSAKRRGAPTLSTVTKTLAALLISASPLAWSGAWVSEKGTGYAKVAYSYYNADDVFGSGGDDLGEFTGQNASYYAEHGLGNNFAVYGTLLYQDLEQSDAAGVTTTSSGFGDTELGIRYQWQAQPFVLSTSFLVKLPFLYDEDDELPRGNGQEDYELRVLIGKSLNQYGYLGFEAGYRLRTDTPSDEYRYLIEYGISVNDNLYLRTKLDGVKSANNADRISADEGDNSTSTGNLSITPEFDLGKLELTAGWNFGTKASRANGGWGVEFTYNHDLYGDTTLQGNGFQIGLTRVY